MNQNKRKLDIIESPVGDTDLKKEKHSEAEPIANDFLRLNDSSFVENDYQVAFETMADKLINDYELVLNEHEYFRLCEIEFYFYHETRHADTFVHRHPEQQHDSNWYFHRQGKSPTASYKPGTLKGLDITFASRNDVSYGGILIRSIQNKKTGQICEGSCLVVDDILNLCNSKSIQELVEAKLNKNLHIFNKNPFIYLRLSEALTKHKLLASPRVGLTLKIPSIDRERFLFRSYRFTLDNYYPTKMKTTILLALVAERYFHNKDEQFTVDANDLSTKLNVRLSTVKANLADLQHGYDKDMSKKTSPLVDYYDKKLSTSDIARAYGIWLKNYRSN